MKLRKCPQCNRYTFKHKCPKCKAKTRNPHPFKSREFKK